MQWTWIVLGIVALLILALIGTYNGLVARRQRVRDAWANVDRSEEHTSELQSH